MATSRDEPAVVPLEYWDMVRHAISRAVRYPARARRLGIEGVIVLRLVIAADGRLLSVEAMEPDADPLLTQTVMEAVRRAAPFEAPQRYGMEGERITAEVPVVFRMK